MHVLVFSLMLGLVTAAPQGYDYQQQDIINPNEDFVLHQRPSTANTQPTVQQYNKEFFYISAPASNYPVPHNFQDQLKNVKKNLRVIFIKSPENNGLANSLLQLSKQTQNTKTAIYVLTKQHKAVELASKLQKQPTRTQAKPEVVFIKYNQPAEAEQAQRTIQQQYETLKGPSRFGFETVAPTHNFIGSGAHTAHVNEAAATLLNYLPATE